MCTARETRHFSRTVRGDQTLEAISINWRLGTYILVLILRVVVVI